MTTYTISDGFAIVRDPVSDDVTAVASSTFELIVPDSETSMSYTVNPLQPGEDPGDETVEIAVDYYNFLINDTLVGDGRPVDPEMSIFEVEWQDGAVTRTSTVLVAYVENDPILGGGTQETDFIFVISGAPLPAINSISDWENFESGITDIKVPDSGPYRPGIDIPLNSLGTDVSENDNITGTAGDDTFSSGAGRDFVEGLGGDDILNGGGGRDTLRGDSGSDTLRGKTGNDKLFGGNHDDKIFAGAGDDTMRGGKGSDTLRGADGDDTAYGDAGRDIIRGEAGNDQLNGGKGNDRMWGDGGRDTLDGGLGNDVMYGGFGSDTFVFSPGDDRIRDFQSRDQIDLRGVASITGFNDLRNNHTEDIGGNLVIDDGAGNTLTLVGFSEADLRANDFIF
ncbi:calcium-binding protein [Sedimentitalea todarodis]|uniref:Calcium-binding protein n=1 Tax=Sedimentitalea todarodis TaxID=1631240 RepID=A0ABU3VLG1_9RHOB|nr:calcium-binding protein [Sedimentitalea todarodis]MDU9006805.1 calcium-binding protein [Sedimentitalea todarodis]